MKFIRYFQISILIFISLFFSISSDSSVKTSFDNLFQGVNSKVGNVFMASWGDADLDFIGVFYNPLSKSGVSFKEAFKLYNSDAVIGFYFSNISSAKDSEKFAIRVKNTNYWNCVSGDCGEIDVLQPIKIKMVEYYFKDGIDEESISNKKGNVVIFDNRSGKKYIDKLEDRFLADDESILDGRFTINFSSGSKEYVIKSKELSFYIGRASSGIYSYRMSDFYIDKIKEELKFSGSIAPSEWLIDFDYSQDLFKVNSYLSSQSKKILNDVELVELSRLLSKETEGGEVVGYLSAISGFNFTLSFLISNFFFILLLLDFMVVFKYVDVKYRLGSGDSFDEVNGYLFSDLNFLSRRDGLSKFFNPTFLFFYINPIIYVFLVGYSLGQFSFVGELLWSNFRFFSLWVQEGIGFPKYYPCFEYVVFCFSFLMLIILGWLKRKLHCETCSVKREADMLIKERNNMNFEIMMIKSSIDKIQKFMEKSSVNK